MDLSGPEFVEIARFPEERRIHEFGLVILSQGAPYWVQQDEAGFYLVVEAVKADQLRRQLDLYRRESVNWPPRVSELPDDKGSSVAALAWLVLMVACFGMSNRWPDLFEAGKVSSEAVMEGEIYRVATALFLHADIGHLAGNLLFGAIFLHLVARHLGGTLAWLGVLMAGAMGNYLNAAIYYPEPHYSVGASTAVFGAVGIIAALPVGFKLRHARRQLARTWALPIIVGMIFLAWFGTGSERTDTSAHLMGFVCGLPLGLVGGYLRSQAVPSVLRSGVDVDGR